MIPEMDALNPACWKFGFDLIAAGSHNFGVDFTRRAFARVFDVEPSVYQRPAAGTTPEIVAVKVRDTAFIGLIGMRTFAAATGILYSAWNHSGTNEANYFPKTAFEAAPVIYSLLHSVSLFNGVRNFMVYGHSYGGYCAPALSYELTRHHGGVTVTCITYGAPRGASEGFPRGSQVPKIIRLFTKGDVVPHIAPHVEEATYYHATGNRATRANANKMRHIGFPIRIWDGNDVTLGTEDTLAVLPNEVSYLGWMYASMTRSDSVHAYSAYHRVLSAIPDRAIPPTVVSPSVVATRSRQSSNPPLIQGLDIAAPRALQVQLEKSRPPDEARRIMKPFIVVRTGDRSWSVQLDGQDVALFGQRSAAKKFAGKGNSFWHSHGPVNGVDVTAFATGYDALIASLRV